MMKNLPKGWSPLSVAPPDEEVEILTENGKKYVAIPCYYPSKNFIQLSETIFQITPEDVPYWDGEWMVDCGNNVPYKGIGRIVGWRPVGG